VSGYIFESKEEIRIARTQKIEKIIDFCLKVQFCFLDDEQLLQLFLSGFADSLYISGYNCRHPLQTKNETMCEDEFRPLGLFKADGI
jgi:hypothetical protein